MGNTNTNENTIQYTRIRLFDLINEVENIIKSCGCTMHTELEHATLNTQTPSAILLIEGEKNHASFAKYLVDKLMLEVAHLNMQTSTQYNVHNDVDNLLQGDMQYASYTLM